MLLHETSLAVIIIEYSMSVCQYVCTCGARCRDFSQSYNAQAQLQQHKRHLVSVFLFYFPSLATVIIKWRACFDGRFSIPAFRQLSIYT